MARQVFIINEPKGDRLLLGKYGEVTQLCPGWIDNKDLNVALDTAIERLEKEYHDGDFMIFGGHAKLNMVAFHWTLKKFNVLRQLLPKKDSWFVVHHDERGGEHDGRKWWIPG